MADAVKTAQETQEVEVSESQIAVHWREEEYFAPPPKFIGQANASDPSIFDRFKEENFPECFKEYADLLTWDKYWHTTLDTSNAPFWKWFVGGRLNASYNCVDRHLAKYRNKAASSGYLSRRTRSRRRSPIRSCTSGSMNSPRCSVISVGSSRATA